VIIGYWRTTKYSGALPAARIKQLIERVESLLAAVKMAREEANGIEAEDMKLGKKVFAYLFAL
jgi:sulfopyruvate decarboxylase TPP-binding subunit